jgi:hypothetical protein
MFELTSIGLQTFQLDTVGFLAILGKGAVLSTSEAATLSWTIFIPRILPAPQALLRPPPLTLQPKIGCIAAGHSGNVMDYINYIGHVHSIPQAFPHIP